MRYATDEEMAQGNSSWTWDVTNERELSPADLFGGRAPLRYY